MLFYYIYNDTYNFALILHFSLSFKTVIPQTCRFKGRKFECGLSISCVLSGGKPVDLCSGGMIWSCCVDRETPQQHDPEENSVSTVQNASEYFVVVVVICCATHQKKRRYSRSNETQ